MTPQTEFIELFAKTAEDNCQLDCRISLKELSEKNSLYAELGQGVSDVVYYDKASVRMFPVMMLCRHKEQNRCLDQLCSICNYFQRLRQYPPGNTFSWLDTEIAKEPSKIGRDEDGTYHYSCILNCKVFF
ncbi:hypothetical protein MCG98_16490 [Ruminococcus sp. OA3]|uniref:hypothetical protein n=1 Tax=Ruminococcus sp. OA3 TaxID=2914164 RepID=UPI001F067A21|nr:hypothetical protein [Ruminococcus sp. OA3]MCH1984166.1 hypothetical protein [Ruminococcus sp. OA3]